MSQQSNCSLYVNNSNKLVTGQLWQRYNKWSLKCTMTTLNISITNNQLYYVT